MADCADVAAAFLAESRALAGLISDFAADDFAAPTAFKGWAVDDIIGHLHLWNWAAALSLEDAAAFNAFSLNCRDHLRAQQAWRAFEVEWRAGLAGAALVHAWLAQAEATAAAFSGADPKARLPWMGPEMSALSSITARLMESWAHGQALYDLRGVERQDGDHIRSIAHLGVSTFGWTYANRRLPVPEQRPTVRLTAPSGMLWEWQGAGGSISGTATAFCQVVTQTRALADSNLRVDGPVAAEWMAMAQCFAGPPNDPPLPGVRGMRA